MTTNDNAPREAAFFTSIRDWGIVRGPEGVLGGVISAVGARVGLAAWPARILVILAAIVLFPVIMIAYAAGWALLPDAEGSIVIQNFGRGVMNVGALIGIGIFALVGFVSFSDFRPFGHAWFGPDIASIDPGTPLRVLGVLFAVLVPVAVLAGVVVLIVWLVRRSSTDRAAAHGTAPATGAAPVYAVTPEQARAAAGSAGAATAASTGSAAPKAPLAPKAPPRPKPPRVPGPGRVFYLLTLAWALIAAAGVAWGAREDLLAIYPTLAWGMVFLTGLGVILVATSLSGRRLGFLGFLGVVGSIIAVLLMANSESLLRAYDDQENPAEAVVDVVTLPLPSDATESFVGQYESIFLGGTCWNDIYWHEGTPSSTARITIPSPVEMSVTHDILAETTTVIIPSGTSLEVTSDGWAQATVVFPDRDLVCGFDGFEGTYVSLINAGEPVVTLAVYDDAIANTIIIEEN